MSVKYVNDAKLKVTSMKRKEKMLEVKNEKTQKVSEEVLIISMQQASISKDEKSKKEENINLNSKKFTV